MTEEDKKVSEILSNVRAHRQVQKMKNYIQHGKVNTFEHCENVAKISYKISRGLRLKVDAKAMLTGAMLHDFYLYDWHDGSDRTHRLHGFSHPERAFRNAKKYFHINEATGHIIKSHMWPLTLRHIPRSREAWIVCVADKCVSLHETLFRR